MKAHFYGFGMGALLGIAARWLPGRLGKAPWQGALILSVYGMYALAWGLAIR